MRDGRGGRGWETGVRRNYLKWTAVEWPSPDTVHPRPGSGGLTEEGEQKEGEEQEEGEKGEEEEDEKEVEFVMLQRRKKKEVRSSLKA